MNHEHSYSSTCAVEEALLNNATTKKHPFCKNSIFQIMCFPQYTLVGNPADCET
jgi:hypothetical protein